MRPTGAPADDLAGVRHLLELGYADPRDEAARQADRERADLDLLKQIDAAIQVGNISAAEAQLASLVSERPDSPAPRRRLAHVYWRLGRREAALECLEWLESNGIEHAELALLRAAIFLSQRRFAEAQDQAEYARHLDDRQAAAELVLGEVHYRRGDLDAAESAFRRAVELKNADGQALTGIAAVALRRNQFEEAAGFAMDALEQNMRLASAHYRLGLALIQLRRYAEARTALETAAAVNPRLAGPFRWLATICQRQDDGAGAAEYRRRGHAVVQARKSNGQVSRELADT